MEVFCSAYVNFIFFRERDCNGTDPLLLICDILQCFFKITHFLERLSAGRYRIAGPYGEQQVESLRLKPYNPPLTHKTPLAVCAAGQAGMHFCKIF